MHGHVYIWFSQIYSNGSSCVKIDINFVGKNSFKLWPKKYYYTILACHKLAKVAHRASAPWGTGWGHSSWVDSSRLSSSLTLGPHWTSPWLKVKHHSRFFSGLLFQLPVNILIYLFYFFLFFFSPKSSRNG